MCCACCAFIRNSNALSAFLLHFKLCNVISNHMTKFTEGKRQARDSNGSCLWGEVNNYSINLLALHIAIFTVVKFSYRIFVEGRIIEPVGITVCKTQCL